MTNTWQIARGFLVFDYSEMDTALRYTPKQNVHIDITGNGTVVEETYEGGKVDYDREMRSKLQAAHSRWRAALNQRHGIPLAADTGKVKDGLRFMSPERFEAFMSEHREISEEIESLNSEASARAEQNGSKHCPRVSLRYHALELEPSASMADMLFESVRGIASALRDSILAGDAKANQSLRNKRAKNIAELTTYVQRRNVERMLDENLAHQEMVREWQGLGNDGAPPAGHAFVVKKGSKSVRYEADYSIYDLVITEHSPFGAGVSTNPPAAVVAPPSNSPELSAEPASGEAPCVVEGDVPAPSGTPEPSVDPEPSQCASEAFDMDEIFAGASPVIDSVSQETKHEVHAHSVPIEDLF